MHGRRKFVIAPIMPCPQRGIPGFAQNLSTEPTDKIFILGIVVVVGELSLNTVECVRRCPKPQNRASPFEVSFESFHPGVIGFDETEKQKQHVGIFNGRDAWDDAGSGFNQAFIRLAEQYGALEAVAFREDSSDCRAGFFAPIFMVGCDEENVFPFARTFIAFVDHMICGTKICWKTGEESQYDDQNVLLLHHFAQLFQHLK